MVIISKLPTNAVQHSNLTVVNNISQKFYQIYFVDKGSSKYDVVTAHGRIGHTAKYLSLQSSGSYDNAMNLLVNTVKAKKKKGYTENKLNLDPISLLPKTKQGTIKPKNLLLIGTATKLKGSKKITTPTLVDPIVEEAKPVKKKPPSFNRLLFLTE